MHQAPANYGEQQVASLTVGLAPILSGHGERIGERQTRGVEAHAVASKVRRSLVIVLLEFVIAHDATA